MPDSVFCFDVDDCLETGGQIRLPSTSGPVTIQSIRATALQGDICGIVGNWTNLPAVVPDWREFLLFLLPPIPSSSSKGFWLAWVRSQYPGRSHYVMVGNDPTDHSQRPHYFDQDWPGTLPVRHVPGDHLVSNDIGAAQEAGFEFLKEDDWAAGHRVGKVPPPDPAKPFYQFPKYTRLPMLYKSFPAPTILKADEAMGVTELLVSGTGNLDYQDDIIDPGAWAKAVATTRPDGSNRAKGVLDHTWGARGIIAKTLVAEEWLPGDKRLPKQFREENAGALYVKAQFNLDKQIARETFSDLKGGYADEFSVGFDIDVNDDGEKCAEGDNVRHIKSIYPWYEWSVVFMGANPLTRPLTAKSADVALAEAEWDVLGDSEKIALYLELDPDLEQLIPEAQLSLKAKWSRAFINRLPDGAFAIIMPGGQKDASGRTAPRSLRKLPHHGPGGAVDKPHLANALSRAAQQPGLKKAISHLRKHADAIGMGKANDQDEPDIVPVHVPDTILKTLGATVGQSVAAALAARRRTS